ncbi:MAG: tRNA (guanosine(46)-N7)-methyltransferase TrmB [Candidatus Nanopelagicales bacterium]
MGEPRENPAHTGGVHHVPESCEAALPERHIRSFHPRRSRISPSAQSALLRLLPVLGMAPSHPVEWPGELFVPALPVVLEIGSGMGEATLQMARATPGVGVLAIEVHTPGVGALLAAVEREGLNNVRVCVGDAVEVMAGFAPGSLRGIRVYFPDPWPKARHHKRRLVQPAFVHRAALLLEPGGLLHLATDIVGYADQMLEAVQGEPLLECPGFVARPAWRPVTKFESRADAVGREVRDLLAVRRLDWTQQGAIAQQVRATDS